MIVKPLPGDEATPKQIKALENILVYKTGGLPSNSYLEIEGMTLNQWFLRQFYKNTNIKIESFEELDKETASNLINELTQ